MRSRFVFLLNLIKNHGLLNVFIYCLYRCFPSVFMLIHSRTNPSGVPWKGMESVSTRYSFDHVLDNSSWVEIGGALEPIKVKSDDARQVFIWFVPDWLNVWGGGHYTLFRFANHFAVKSGIRNIIYVYDNKRFDSPEYLTSDLKRAFKDCRLEVIVDPKLLPSCSAAIATTWQSAYFVRAFPFVGKKFYFMQDYESYFYPHGTMAMQANNSYTFGFKGITGGMWLKDCYESHGGEAINYRFAADKNIFYPTNALGKVRSQVRKIFFYGRPSTERRCFELGILSLERIARYYPDVEIVIAGLTLDKEPDFRATLLGNLSLEETGELYRTCDIGIAFSGSNLSYLPVELMASGVPVISNNGPHVEWHCEHGVNAYLVEPTPTAVFEAFKKLYDDSELRQKLVDGGIKTMTTLSWENQMDNVLEYIQSELASNELNANQKIRVG